MINPYFSLQLIEADHDDDKFVDCAFAANATFIVSDDKHYAVLKDIVSYITRLKTERIPWAIAV